MIAIALRTIRFRWMGMVGAFVATALAVALVSAWAVLMESSLRAKVPPERLAGSAIVVAGKQNLTIHYGHGENRESASLLMPERVRINADLAGTIAALPGVKAAVPDVSFTSTLQSDGKTVAGPQTWGHGWSSAALTPFSLRAGHSPGAGEVVVDAALARAGHISVGEQVRLLTPGGVEKLTVSGIAAPNGADGLKRQSAVFVADSSVAAFAGDKSIDAVGVLPKPGASTKDLAGEIKHVAGAGTVLTGADRGKAEFLETTQGLSDLTAIAGSIGGVSIAIAVFVVAGALSLSVQQRNREVALLRAVGATPRQIRRMIAVEGLVVSIVAALVGVLPGLGLARWMAHSFTTHGILGAPLHVYADWPPFLIAGGIGVFVVQAASFIAARRAGKIRPTAALQESGVEPPRMGIFRILLGTAALGGGIALLFVSMSMSGDSEAATSVGVVMILMSAVGLLGPVIAKVGALIGGLPMRGMSQVGGFLAAVNSSARARRLASAVTPVALTVSLAFVSVFLQSTVSHAEQRQGTQRMIADRIVTAPGPGLPPATIAQLQHVSGVDTAVGLLPTQVEIGHDLNEFPAQAVTPGRLDRVLDLHVTKGSVASLPAGSVALSSMRAQAMHVTVGDRVTLRLGDGTEIRPMVAAIFGRGLGFADVVLPWQLTAGHVTTPAVSTALVRLAPGAHHVDAALAATYPGAHIADRASYRAQQQHDEKENAWINLFVLGIVVAFAGVAMVNTMVMTVTERRREFALMRLVGATSRQVLGMLRWESVLIALLGIGVGTAVGLATLVPFSEGATGSIAPYVAPIPYALIAVGAAVLAILANLLPGRAALRQHPVDAIGIRE